MADPLRFALTVPERRAVWDSCGLLIRISQGPILEDLDRMCREAAQPSASGFTFLESTAWLTNDSPEKVQLIRDALELCAKFRADVAIWDKRRQELQPAPPATRQQRRAAERAKKE